MGVSLNMENRDDYDENEPDYFFDTKWPHPRLRKNRQRGKDEALAWFMEFYREDIEHQVDFRRLPKNKRCVRVKVKAKFRCHKCKKGWKSNMAWISFDMKNQEVSRMFGQKCNVCKEFYSMPFPFFYSEQHWKYDGTTPWRFAHRQNSLPLLLPVSSNNMNKRRCQKH